jgi:TrpR-related protein YerC/YecD
MQREPLSEDEHLALFEAILSLKNTEEVARFMEDLCTPAELQDLSDRWQVVPYLMKDTPYRKIYEQTGVSVTTVGRVARAIKYGTGGYNLIYTRTKGKQNVRKTNDSHSKKWALK